MDIEYTKDGEPPFILFENYPYTDIHPILPFATSYGIVILSNNHMGSFRMSMRPIRQAFLRYDERPAKNS